MLPAKDGFAAADSGTACLVLGRHTATGGEMGRFRDEGSNSWVGQMTVGDCWGPWDPWECKVVDDPYKAPLTSVPTPTPSRS